MIAVDRISVGILAFCTPSNRLSTKALGCHMLEELDELTIDGLVDCFMNGWGTVSDSVPPDPTLLYTEVADRLARHESPGADALVRLFEHFEAVFPPQDEKFAAVLFGLGSVATLPDAMIEHIRGLIAHDAPRVASAAIDCLRRRDDAGAEAQVRQRFPVAPPVVAAEALKYLVQLDSRRIHTDLLDGIAHPSPIVRFAAVNLIDDLQSADLVEAARTLVNDPDEDIRVFVSNYML